MAKGSDDPERFRLRRMEMSGRARSSSNTVSRMQWTAFSLPQWARTAVAKRSGVKVAEET
jgi:hypothetical protein